VPVRDDEVEGVGLVAQLEAVGVAQVVAVDLVGEGAVALDGDGGDVGPVVDPAVVVTRRPLVSTAEPINPMMVGSGGCGPRPW